MTNKYKVWVEIEEEDVDGSTEPERVGEPECVGYFKTQDEAIDFVSSMEGAHKHTDEQGKEWTFLELLAERDRLDNIAQEQIGKNLLLVTERDDLRERAEGLHQHVNDLSEQIRELS